MAIAQQKNETSSIDFEAIDIVQAHITHALELYRLGNSDEMQRAQMLWEYAKEYMWLSNNLMR